MGGLSSLDIFPSGALLEKYPCNLLISQTTLCSVPDWMGLEEASRTDAARAFVAGVTLCYVMPSTNVWNTIHCVSQEEGGQCVVDLEGEKRRALFLKHLLLESCSRILNSVPKTPLRNGRNLQFPSFRLDTKVPQYPAHTCCWWLFSASWRQRDPGSSWLFVQQRSLSTLCALQILRHALGPTTSMSCPLGQIRDCLKVQTGNRVH